MTTAAWTMLGATWAIILFFTGKFFFMVLSTPQALAEDDHTEDGILRKDA